MKKILCILFVFLFLVTSAYGACEIEGTLDYNKFVGGKVNHEVIYQAIDGYNFTEAKIYYPQSSLIKHYNNTASNLTQPVTISTDFNIQSGTNYLLYNFTNVNRTAPTNITYECSKFEISTPDDIMTSLVTTSFLILFGATVIIAMILIVAVKLSAFANDKKEEGADTVISIVYTIIGFIILLSLVSAFIAIFY